MATSTGSIKIFRGDNHVVNVTIVQGSDAVDLTSASVVLSIKRKETDSVYLLQKTGTITDAAEGKVEFSFAPSDTLSLKPGNYPYDVQVTLGNRAVYTVLKDVFSLMRDITTP